MIVCISAARCHNMERLSLYLPVPVCWARNIFKYFDTTTTNILLLLSLFFLNFFSTLFSFLVQILFCQYKLVPWCKWYLNIQRTSWPVLCSVIFLKITNSIEHRVGSVLRTSNLLRNMWIWHFKNITSKLFHLTPVMRCSDAVKSMGRLTIQPISKLLLWLFQNGAKQIYSGIQAIDSKFFLWRII